MNPDSIGGSQVQLSEIPRGGAGVGVGYPGFVTLHLNNRGLPWTVPRCIVQLARTALRAPCCCNISFSVRKVLGFHFCFAELYTAERGADFHVTMPPTGPVDFKRSIDYAALKDRNVLVTGGASGFGKAFVHMFADHGANVVVADLQDDLGKALEKELANKDGKYACNQSVLGVMF